MNAPPDIMGPMSKLSQTDIAVDYYLILGISRRASDREISEACEEVIAMRPRKNDSTPADRAFDILRSRGRHIMLVRKLRREYEQQRKLWDLGAFGSGGGFILQSLGDLDEQMYTMEGDPFFCVWCYLTICTPLGKSGLEPRYLILAAYLWASRSLFWAWRGAYEKNPFVDSIPALWDVDRGLLNNLSLLCLEETEKNGKITFWGQPQWRLLLDVVAKHRLYMAFRECERDLWWWFTDKFLGILGPSRCLRLNISTLAVPSFVSDKDVKMLLCRTAIVGKEWAYQLPFAPSYERACDNLNIDMEEPYPAFPDHGDEVGPVFAEWHARVRQRALDELKTQDWTTTDHIQIWVEFGRSYLMKDLTRLSAPMESHPPINWSSGTWTPPIGVFDDDGSGKSPADTFSALQAAFKLNSRKSVHLDQRAKALRYVEAGIYGPFGAQEKDLVTRRQNNGATAKRRLEPYDRDKRDTIIKYGVPLIHWLLSPDARCLAIVSPEPEPEPEPDHGTEGPFDDLEVWGEPVDGSITLLTDEEYWGSYGNETDFYTAGAPENMFAEGDAIVEQLIASVNQLPEKRRRFVPGTLPTVCEVDEEGREEEVRDGEDEEETEEDINRSEPVDMSGHAVPIQAIDLDDDPFAFHPPPTPRFAHMELPEVDTDENPLDLDSAPSPRSLRLAPAPADEGASNEDDDEDLFIYLTPRAPPVAPLPYVV